MTKNELELELFFESGPTWKAVCLPYLDLCPKTKKIVRITCSSLFHISHIWEMTRYHLVFRSDIIMTARVWGDDHVLRESQRWLSVIQSPVSQPCCVQLHRSSSRWSSRFGQSAWSSFSSLGGDLFIDGSWSDRRGAPSAWLSISCENPPTVC